MSEEVKQLLILSNYISDPVKEKKKEKSKNGRM